MRTGRVHSLLIGYDPCVSGRPRRSGVGVEAGSWRPVCVQEPRTPAAGWPSGQSHSYHSPSPMHSGFTVNPLWSVLELKVRDGADHSP